MTTLNFILGLSLLFYTSISNARSNDNREAQFLSEVANQNKTDDTRVPFLNEVSDGLSFKDISPACDPKLFEDQVLSKKNSTADYYHLIRNYFSNCGGELSLRSWKGSVASLLKSALWDYSFFQNPQVTEFTIKLPNGTQVPAFMAMKQDSRPRPLVVVKCGVFCSIAESPSLKEYLMSLFDQSPFNVVVLANQTGLDHISLNHLVSMGGWSEGLEVMAVGKWLKEEWMYKDRISSIHLMGISLGGNAAVFGAAYNDMYPQTDGSKVYNSVLGICPVVSLRPTLDSLYNSPIIGDIFAKDTRDQFTAARGDVTDIPDLLTDKKIPQSKFEMADFVGLITSTSLQRRGVASVTPATFFKNNNFWNLKQKVTTPFMVWASKDDIIVNNKLNGQVLENDDYYQNSPTVTAVNLPYGSHCGFAAAYGVLSTSVVLKTFVLTHSPEFTDYNAKTQMPWTFGFRKMFNAEEHVGQIWKFTANSNQVKVQFRIFNYSKSSTCTDEGPWAGDDNCISTYEYTLPMSSLTSMGARMTKNSVEAAALSREFNAKVEFKTKDLKPLNGTNTTDFVMVWRSL